MMLFAQERVDSHIAPLLRHAADMPLLLSLTLLYAMDKARRSESKMMR